MKLDKDAVRSILLAIEANSQQPMGWIDIEVPGLSHDEFSYHVQLLDEAGFIEAQDLNGGMYDWRPTRLTYAGHEFLDTVRDNEVWRLTKEGAKKVGASSVTVIFDISKAIVKQKLIEHGFHV